MESFDSITVRPIKLNVLVGLRFTVQEIMNGRGTELNQADSWFGPFGL